MILLFPVGLPAIYFTMLFTSRRVLFDKDEEGGGISSQMEHLSFFFGEYAHKRWYWEVVECLRKCTLMGFASFYKPGTLMQLIAVIVVTTVYIMVLTNYQPYIQPLDVAVAIWNQMMLFFTLLGALMIKFQQGFSATGVYEEGYDASFVNTLLIASGFGVFLVNTLCSFIAFYGVIHDECESNTKELEEGDGNKTRETEEGNDDNNTKEIEEGDDNKTKEIEEVNDDNVKAVFNSRDEYFNKIRLLTRIAAVNSRRPTRTNSKLYKVKGGIAAQATPKDTASNGIDLSDVAKEKNNIQRHEEKEEEDASKKMGFKRKAKFLI